MLNQLITPEDKAAIMAQDTSYLAKFFTVPHLSNANDNLEVKKALLTFSLMKCKIKAMKFLIDNGTPVQKDDINFRFIVEKKKDVSILEYLETKGLDFENAPVLLWIASMNNNEPYTKFLANKIKEMDNKYTIVALHQVLNKNSNNLLPSHGVLSILLSKITQDSFDNFLNNPQLPNNKKEENKIYLKKLYLDINLPQSSQASPTLKI